MNTQIIKSQFTTVKTFWLLLALIIFSVFLRELPIISMLFAPFNQFEVLVHEMGHAIACVFTGGWVSGLTIVEDGNGHGGLTFTHGGIPFIYMQAGYLGETLWGCLLIALSRFPRIARAILILIGVVMGIASVAFMTGAMFMPGMFFQGLFSLLWGLAISAGLIYVGSKLSNAWAHGLLLFIAVQSCLSSLSGIWALFLQSLGLFPGTWSDATNMAGMTHIPAFVWGIGWSLFSVGMLSWVMWLSFKADGHLDKKEKSRQLEEKKVKSIDSKQAIEHELLELQQSLDQGQKIKIKKEERHHRQ